jgi:hypothetical protein
MFVPSSEVVDVLERLHSIKCLARTMFKQPLNTYPFYKNRKHLPKVLHFVDNLSTSSLPSIYDRRRVIRIKEVLS